VTTPRGSELPEPTRQDGDGHLGKKQQRTGLRRFWPVARYLLGIGVLVLAVWVLSSHTDELSGLSTALDNLNWWWIPLALVAEALSFVCFTGMEQKLLTSGGVVPPWFPLLRMTFASQAITNSVPAGSAVSAVYGFRWFRRFGADDTVAVWAMVGTFIGSMVALSVLAAAGLGLATSEGASLDLIPVIIGVLVIAVVVGALFVYERPLFLALTWGMRASQSIFRRPRGDTAADVDRIVRRVTSVQLGWRQVMIIVLWGLGSWIFDCMCFAVMFLAIGTTIPWNGLLLAYGAGQLAAALPITPGGLGAVEGSITIALVAFGGAHVSTVDAVLLYRLVSFWLVLVVGWLLWGEMALEVRRGRWPRHALESPVEVTLNATPEAVATLVADGSTESGS
jgi:putative heme transporter